MSAPLKPVSTLEASLDPWFWPDACELGDCMDRVTHRIRVNRKPIYLCNRHALSEPFDRAPLHTVDRLRDE